MGDRDYTTSMETARRHALENNMKHLQAAQMLEKKMNTRERWRPGSLEWEAAAAKVVMRRYQRCIDILEGLVVARMFELTKMNMSQTGASYFSHWVKYAELSDRLQSSQAHRKCSEVTITGYPNRPHQLQCCRCRFEPPSPFS